ncbi:MAG: RsmB/NOP family class I SAM-dependent RNA methyltransferase, partial [Trueperaceae bacterium]
MRRVHRGAFAAPSLSSAMDGLAEARDRGLLTDLVYGTLRNQLLLDACLAGRLPAPQRLPEDARNALRLATYELLIRGTPPHAAVDEWVEVVKASAPRLAGLANAVLRRVEVPANLPWDVLHSLPAWLAERLRALLGDAAVEAAAGMLTAEPLWLSSFGEDAARVLVEDGCEVSDGPVTGSLAVRIPRPLATLNAFRNGLVQPQNPASRLSATLLAPAAGERVLDLASGNGIKSAQLAYMGARVTAVEIDRRKVERAESNLARLGLGVEHLVADLRRKPDLPPALKVILDAPCSGTGTLRGNPEIKLRLREHDIAELTTLQAAMLDTAAALTSPGGTLVYSVCALTADEGPVQVERFLARHDEFEPLSVELPLEPPAEGSSNRQVSLSAGPGRVVLPISGLDGFFIAR